MFLGAKKISISVKKGVSENKGCPKNMILGAIFFISMKNRGCPKTKGVRKHEVITVMPKSCKQQKRPLHRMTSMDNRMQVRLSKTKFYSMYVFRGILRLVI